MVYAKNRLDMPDSYSRSVYICDRNGHGVVPNVKRIFQFLMRVATVVFVNHTCCDSNMFVERGND